MIITFHEPTGTYTRDTDTMTQAELEVLGLADLPRIAQICATSPGAITMPEVWELLRILAKHAGLWSPP